MPAIAMTRKARVIDKSVKTSAGRRRALAAGEVVEESSEFDS